jgi:hypothetical protein
MIGVALDSPVSRVLEALGDSVKSTGPGKWSARCPTHDDRHASLTVTSGDDGKALLKCHAGCSAADIVSQLGMTLRDLFPPREKSNGNGHARRIVQSYDYIDADGELRYQSVRYSPKDFRQRRPDGRGGWIWSMGDVERILYHLPALLNSAEDDPDGIVFVIEGEKDADRLATFNFIATTNVGGAGKWKGTDGDRYAETLRGRRLVILSDNDSAGRNHAQDVARTCHGKAKDIRVIELPGLPTKGDVSDWLDAGGTREELFRIVESAPSWTPAEIQPSATTPPAIQSVRSLMKLYPALRPPVVHGLLRRGETMNIIAPPKTGKSWLVTDLGIALATGRTWLGQFDTERGDVLILDNELHGETSAARIPKVAAARGVIVDQFADHLYVENLRGKLRDVFNLRTYFESLQPGQFKAIILDAFYRFLPRDTDENDNATMAAIYSHLDLYADRLGCCFILIHHSSKGTQADKSVTDVGAGAGSQSRATDTHLILRQHEQDGVVVLDAAVRSWAPVVPKCLRWEFPIWTPETGLDPSQLRRPGRQTKRAEEQADAKPEKIAWTPQLLVEKFLSDLPKTEATLLTATDAFGVSERKAARLLAAAVESGIAFEWVYADRRQAHRFATTPQPVALTNSGGVS